MIVDAVFPVRGGELSTDHAYPLFAALSREVAALHDPEAGLRFAPINGVRGAKGGQVQRQVTTGDGASRATG
jgi:hypothetical protein